MRFTGPILPGAAAPRHRRGSLPEARIALSRIDYFRRLIGWRPPLKISFRAPVSPYRSRDGRADVVAHGLLASSSAASPSMLLGWRERSALLAARAAGGFEVAEAIFVADGAA